MNIPDDVKEFITTVRAAHDELCPMVASNPDGARNTLTLMTMMQVHNLYAAIIGAVEAVQESSECEASELRSEANGWKTEYSREFIQRTEADERVKELTQANAHLSSALAQTTAANDSLRVKAAHLEDHLARLLNEAANDAVAREAELRIDVAHMRELADRAACFQNALHSIRIALIGTGLDHIARLIDKAIHEK